MNYFGRRASRHNMALTTVVATMALILQASTVSAQQLQMDTASTRVMIAQTDTSYYFVDLDRIRLIDGGKALLVHMIIDPRPGDYFEDSLSVPRIGQIDEGWRVDCERGAMVRYDRALYDRFLKRVSYSVDSVSTLRRYPIGTIAAYLILFTCKHNPAAVRH